MVIIKDTWSELNSLLIFCYEQLGFCKGLLSPDCI